MPRAQRDIRTLSSLVLVLLANTAQAISLTCPAVAPTEWGTPNARLETIRVLSIPTGETMDEKALPIMAPSTEWQRGGVLHQVWNMNVDAPKFSDTVDCIYSGTERFIRLDASKAKRCMAKVRMQNQKIVKNSLVFRCE